MLITLVILTALIAVVTLLPLSRGKAWWIRGWDFPRAQIGTLAAVLAAIIVVRGAESTLERVLLGVSLAIGTYQLWWIRPFTRLHRRDVKWHRPGAPGVRLRLIAVNVLQSNRRAARLRRLIGEHRPDLLLAVETDRWWLEQLEPLRRELPHQLTCPLDNFYGMLLFSRWPLHDGRIQFLVERGTPSIHVCVVLPGAAPLRLVCLHPAPPSPTENEESTERDAELLVVARSLTRERRPTIVMGDLNDVAWSRTTRLFRKISGLLDPRVGRGLFNTFHARWPFARWPVDHLFHSRHFTLVQLRRLPAFGSDHFPVFAELALNGGERANEPPLPADADDWREARDESVPSRNSVHVPRSPPPANVAVAPR